MNTAARGGALLVVLLVAIVLLGFAALGFHFSEQIGTLEETLTQQGRDSRRASAERESLRSELAKLHDLYGLIGSELADKDQKFSEVLAAALVTKEQEIRENRMLVQGIRDSVDRLAGALQDESVYRKESFGEIRRDLASYQSQVSELGQSLSDLTEELDNLARTVASTTEKWTDSQEALRKLNLERDDIQDQRLVEHEETIRAELSRFQVEMKRLDSRLEDLNHKLRRFELHSPD